MDYKDNDFAKTYLAHMDKVVFLSKEDQIKIGFTIKTNEKLILENCIKYSEFRKQLLTLKVAIERNPDNIVKFSKHLEDNSKTAMLTSITESFDNLFLNLEDGSDELCIKYLDEINLTSSTLNQLLMPIKERHRTLQEFNQKMTRVFSFLEVNSIDEVLELEKQLFNKTQRSLICKRLYSDESRISNYILEAKDLIKFKEKEQLDQDSCKDLVQLYKKIRQLESKVEEQRRLLIESNLPLVINRAKRYMNQGLDFEDLVQEGNIGLIKAVDKFEPSKNIKVTTFATWWIDQAIRRAISNKAKTVRIPIHIQDVIQKINKAYHKLCHELGREPNHEEIAEHSKIKLKVIKDVFATAQHEVGISEEIGSGVAFSDILPDTGMSPFSKMNKDTQYHKIREALALLSPKYEKLIRMRYGIGEKEPHTLEECGKFHGFTRERARQVEKNGLKKLREKFIDQELKESLDE